MANDLKHIGTPRHSGRYPWGSGKDPQQRNGTFLGTVKKLHKEGLDDKEIARVSGLKNTTALRQLKTIQRETEWLDKAAMATRLKEKGLSNVAIGKRMGINESSVRSYLNPALQERAKITSNIAHVLRNRLGETNGVLDIGSGTEIHLGVSKTKLDTAIGLIESEGKYRVRYVKVKQQGTGKDTTVKVLAPVDMPYSELRKPTTQIHLLNNYSEDGGRSVQGLEPVRSLNSNRVHIRYGDEGGADRDGLVEIRRGVEDLSLGGKNYAQVRIGVDGTNYMKGMAVYSDNVPEGFDVIYNTNKKRGAPFEKVFKPMEKVNPNDPNSPINTDNPFGSSVRQKHYIDSQGKKQLSPIQVVNEEGSWENWSKTLSSQVLSKQLPAVAKKQLDLALEKKNQEFKEIMSLTNPAVKKRLLETFSDECDSATVDLKAAAMPRQANKVLIPFTSIKEHEVYAPSFKDGEPVVLIRHPHGGIFEIPELIVNNKNKEAIETIGKHPVDAIGINPKVAAKLSGADFDGDTVLVIPNKSGAIRTSPSIKTLLEFDPKTSYKLPPGSPKLEDRAKQRLMGEVSNLITDMTIKKANEDEIVRAVKHSMVVIDAVKHDLDYKRSANDFGIPALRKKYQGGERSGASTLISLAGSDERVQLRKEKSSIDPVTGEKIHKYVTNQYTMNSKGKKVRVSVNSPEEAKAIGLETYIVDRKKKRNPVTGQMEYVQIKPKVVERMTTSKKMLETKDARTLSSGTRIENIYADHANSLKALANQARLAYLNTKDTPYSPSAKLAYKKEVESLDSKLRIAYYNKPKERQAQLYANKVISAQRQKNPFMEPAELKKFKGQALEEARNRVGAKKEPIVITDREWEAIQAGAISKNKLYSILLNADIDAIKQRALPKASKLMTPSSVDRARSMLKAGRTTAEVAEVLGVSISTVNRALE